MARKQSNIRRRGSAWQIYYYDPEERCESGQRKKQRSKTFSDDAHGGEKRAREAALLFLARTQTTIRAGTYRAPERITFAELTSKWLAFHAPRVRPVTLTNYESVFRVHLLPQFGRRLVSEITAEMLDEFVADWSRGGPMFEARQALAVERETAAAAAEGRPARAVRLGRSPKTIGNALVPLKRMLRDAVRWGYISANPAVEVERPRVESRHDEMRCLDAAEVARLLDAAAADPFGHALLLCAATTGVRRGELLGLRWGDVDWTRGRIFVRRSIGGRGVVQQPKTRTSVRAIAMPATLASTLKRHRMAVAGKELDDYVFPSEAGTPLDGRNVARRFLEPALKRARLPQMRWHDLRHTYASLLIAQGAHPKLIQEQLGHASVSITLDRYGHLMDQSVGDAGAHLEAALFGGAREAVTIEA